MNHAATRALASAALTAAAAFVLVCGIGLAARSRHTQ